MKIFPTTIYYAEDFRVNLSVSQENKRALKTKDLMCSEKLPAL